MAISVLISVYQRENPKYFDRAVQSIKEQELRPMEVVIVKEGPLTKELDDVIEKYQKDLPMNVIALRENVQLGRALQAGLKACKGEIVARMDSDDIATKDRLRLQYAFLCAHHEISAVGSDIAEFIHEGEYLRIKHMPTAYEDLFAYGKLRNPLNHMSVMFRRKDILSVGGYTHFPGLEDYDLWSRLLAGRKRIANIPKVLMEARIDRDFSGRRGGIEYFKIYVKLRRHQHTIGYTTIFEMMIGILCSAGMTLQPRRVRNLFYQLLRKKR